MSRPPATPLERLRAERPEWQPWLAVVEDLLREVSDPVWDEAADATSIAAQPGRPLLADATLSVPAKAVTRLLERLIRTASRCGTSTMATLSSVLRSELDAARLFRASLCGGDAAKELAAEARTDPDLLQEVAALLPVPFLQACNRRWREAIPADWVQGFCPVCGSWPAFVEVRGIERSRCFRCARCGSEWHARMLRCAYCGLDDHDRLASLAPESGGRHAIEACGRCLGYVKAVTTLDGCPPVAVMIEDLASVDLDLAALDLGYMRPLPRGQVLQSSILQGPTPDGGCHTLQNAGLQDLTPTQ